MNDQETLDCELAVIGAGMAGMSSAFFAAQRGISTTLVGGTAQIVYSTGLLDLLGVHPVQSRKGWANPWDGIDALIADIPGHPYARVPRDDIRTAFDEILDALSRAGLPYIREPDRNIDIVTPIGTLKRTWCVPRGMAANGVAWREKPPCLLVDFRGMKDYSARQIGAALKDSWPGLRTVRIDFPGTAHLAEVSTEYLARTLDLPEHRQRLIDALRPHVDGVLAIGFPAVLGFHRSGEVLDGLTEALGMPIFEIPTTPVSVPGLRLQEALQQAVMTSGGRLLQKQVLEVARDSDGWFLLQVGARAPEHVIRARYVVLASGRFLGGGLHADRQQVREALFDLPVYQPDNRAGWHRKDMRDPRGHPLNLAGLEVDDAFHPLDRSGRPAFEHLFAVGSILAHQDWTRMKCGAGLAIASAWGAVKAVVEAMGRGDRI